MIFIFFHIWGFWTHHNECTWVVYGISQFREQRSDRKPCVTRNEDYDHYLAAPNYRIIYVAHGGAHVAQVYILYYGGQWWRRWWAIESQLVIGHHPVHSDHLHYPSSIKTNWWMIKGFTHVVLLLMRMMVIMDDTHHWLCSCWGSLNHNGGIMKGRWFQFIPNKIKFTPCKKCEIPMHAKENIHLMMVHSWLRYCPLNN